MKCFHCPINDTHSKFLQNFELYKQHISYCRDLFQQFCYFCNFCAYGFLEFKSLQDHLVLCPFSEQKVETKYIVLSCTPQKRFQIKNTFPKRLMFFHSELFEFGGLILKSQEVEIIKVKTQVPETPLNTDFLEFQRELKKCCSEEIQQNQKGVENKKNCRISETRLIITLQNFELRLGDPSITGPRFPVLEQEGKILHLQLIENDSFVIESGIELTYSYASGFFLPQNEQSQLLKQLNEFNAAIKITQTAKLRKVVVLCLEKHALFDVGKENQTINLYVFNCEIEATSRKDFKIHIQKKNNEHLLEEDVQEVEQEKLCLTFESLELRELREELNQEKKKFDYLQIEKIPEINSKEQLVSQLAIQFENLKSLKKMLKDEIQIKQLQIRNRQSLQEIRTKCQQIVEKKINEENVFLRQEYEQKKQILCDEAQQQLTTFSKKNEQNKEVKAENVLLKVQRDEVAKTLDAVEQEKLCLQRKLQNLKKELRKSTNQSINSDTSWQLCQLCFLQGIFVQADIVLLPCRHVCYCSSSAHTNESKFFCFYCKEQVLKEKKITLI